ncbi:MAG: GGDEF domain-containing protein [Hamadaea sp.]|nr:GGDEF domain-containing protein [Hamadaea sp.]
MRGRGLLVAFAAGMAMLAIAYFATPSDALISTVLWGALGVAGASAMVLGARINASPRQTAWRLLAAGVLLQALGDCAAQVMRLSNDVDQAVPLPIHILYVGMFVCVVLGLLQLARTGQSDRDRAGLLDAVAVTIGAGLLCWVFLVEPAVKPGLEPADMLLVAGYPIGQLVIVSLIVWLLLGMRPSASLALLAVGAFVLAAGVVHYLLALLHGDWQTGTASDLAWIAFDVSWGAAALHPSMARLTQPRDGDPVHLTPARLGLLAVCSLMPSVVLIGMALHSAVHAPVVVGLTGTAMVLLVLARLMGALRRQEQLLRVKHELTHRAYHDPLTGLANRARFDDDLARAAGDGGRVGLLLVDLDDFKQVNDTFGHVAGDELLNEVASRLRSAAGSTGTAARIGGDEFAILVSEANHALVESIAEGVVHAFRAPIRVDGHHVDISVSVGVATSDVSPGDRLLHDADRALYRAKAAGGRRWDRHATGAI